MLLSDYVLQVVDHGDCNRGSEAVERQRDNWDDLKGYYILLGTCPQQECFPLAYRRAFEVVEREPNTRIIDCQSEGPNKTRLTPEPFRIFDSSLINPLASIGPIESATFCSIMPNLSPVTLSPFTPRPEGDLM